MKPQLLLLSDLWGFQQSHWQQHYPHILGQNYDITLIDCCTLADVKTSQSSQEVIHQQFINGGIDKGVNSLLDKKLTSDLIIGCSIGGLIAWKAMLQGLKAEKLIAISATRLRYEINKPEGDLTLYYGEEDPYKPTNS